MGRLRVAAGCLATIMLLVSQTGYAVPSALQIEPAMQLARQLSAPAATEEERDLLRREYRLIQGASEFWVRFDSLNARIHGGADLIRSLRSLIEDAPAPRQQTLLTSLETVQAVAAPMATALPVASASAVRPAKEEGGLSLALAAAALGGLTMFLIRLRSAKPRPQSSFVAPSSAAALDVPSQVPAVSVAPTQISVPIAPSQVAELDPKQLIVPAPGETPFGPVDPVREEMDHALDLAEVMLSYGRITGAMQALKNYLYEHPTVSIRPWLKLLDLHRQTGMREDFERTAETLHRHFNVKVPGWDEGISGVPLRSFFGEEEGIEILGLEQLPHILAKIQATWPDESCLEYLRHLLVDNRGGGRMGFPVSVVAEILLLEDILNDRLAGQA